MGDNVYCNDLTPSFPTDNIAMTDIRLKAVKITNIVILAFASSAILLSLSRASILGVMIIGFLLLFFENKKIFISMSVPIMLLVFIVYPFIKEHEQFERITRVSKTREIRRDDIAIEEKEDMRINLFKKAMTMFKERPLTGYGPGSFRITTISDFKTGGLIAHSIYTSALAETGILGTTVLFIALAYPFFMTIRRYNQDINKLFFLIFIPFFGVMFTTHGIVYSPFVWALLGMLTGISSIGNKSKRSISPKKRNFNVVPSTYNLAPPPYDYYPSYNQLKNISDPK